MARKEDNADFRLRRAVLGDLGFIRETARAAYQPYVERIGREPAPMVADFATAIETGTVEIIESRGEPAGYCISWLEADHLFVENVALAPSMHGNGLARKLFDILEQRALATGSDSVRLYTNAKMTENLDLYPHLGFRVTDRRTEAGFDRVYFEKKLAVET